MNDGKKLPDTSGVEFKQDAIVDKPGIVGARWWHQGLLDEESKVSRRQALVGFAMATGLVSVVTAMGSCIASLGDDYETAEATSIAQREALAMQRRYGWDFGARGVPLVFDGIALGPFVRTELEKLAATMTPVPGTFARYHVPTLVESLTAAPANTLPDPQDGRPRPDAAPFKRLADIIVPISTPAMAQAYACGEALARMALGRKDVAVVVDLPGPQAVAFAAGASASFEPVLLLDNWPHPQGVVPSHLTLAAMAYYQPRFAARKATGSAPPLFVLDRSRLAAYTDSSDRFDNRYYARCPKLSVLSKEGIKTAIYVVAAPSALPEPDDLNLVFAAPKTEAPVDVRVLSLDEFKTDGSGKDNQLYYGGSGRAEDGFWMTYHPNPGGHTLMPAPAQAPGYQFTPRVLGSLPPVATVPVVLTASGLILAAALDRRGSMNRFSGGWSG